MPGAGREQLVVSFELLSRGAHSAAILPVPGRPRVDVLSNRRIGAHQVATLGAGSQTGALSTWLSHHGYTLPPGAQPIIASYLHEGWGFVAVRLAHRADGALTPLRIRFASTRAIYPMRVEQLGHES